jgi:hypothetical protein
MGGMNRLSTEERVRIVQCLVEGMSIQATCRMTGFAKGTVLKLLTDLGAVCDAFHDERVQGLRCRRIQCDEIWAFCYAKERTVKKQPLLQIRKDGAGDIWTWTALDADTKLISDLVHRLSRPRSGRSVYDRSCQPRC